MLLKNSVSLIGVDLSFVDILDHVTPLTATSDKNNASHPKDAEPVTEIDPNLLPPLGEIATEEDILPGTCCNVAVRLRRFLPQRAQVSLTTYPDAEVVTDENKERYLELLAWMRLHDGMKDSVECILARIYVGTKIEITKNIVCFVETSCNFTPRPFSVSNTILTQYLYLYCGILYTKR